MQPVSCNLCGNEAYTVIFDAGVAQINRIVKCKHCGLLYANPRMSSPDVDLIRDYDPEWVLEHVTTTNKWRLEKELLQLRDYRTTKRFLAERFPDRGTLVEIGCGMGYLLNFFAKDGWMTIGVEPNVGLGSYARKEFGLKVIDGTLEEAKFASGSADVATMMHVIEHVPDPTATLAEIYRVLKPGGCFVLETPRYDTLIFKLLGRRERSLSCDGHIYFFTSETLVKVTRKVGFSVIKTDYVGRSLSIERLLYNVGIICKRKTIQKTLQNISDRLQLNRLAITLNFRDMQRMYLEKPISPDESIVS